MRHMVELVTPFPVEDYKWSWKVLAEFPDYNFDDLGPKTFGDYVKEMNERQHVERVTQVLADGVRVGVIGFRPVSLTTGFFHGITFTSSVHHTGIPQTAVSMFLDDLWANGIKKVSAAFFAPNHRIQNFLIGLGFEEEGYLKAHATQGGKPVDMRLMAKFSPCSSS